MKIKATLSSVLTLIIGLTIWSVPSAQAETLKFPCGPEGATYSVLMPQGVAIDGTKCFGAITIDKSVTTIGVKAFFGAMNLTSVVIPEGVTLIDEMAFFSTGLSQVSIPNTVTTINRSAFGFNEGLTSVTLPSSLTRVSAQVFMFTRLDVLTIPSSVKVIESSAFAGAPITSLILPDTITEIGQNAFEGSKLVNVTIPDSVRVLGASVFKDNTVLTSISLPDQLNQIGLPAFAGNYSLTKIYFCGKFQAGTFPIAQTCPPERQALIDANAAAELKAKQEADAKAAADKTSSELKAKQDAEIKVAADNAALIKLKTELSAASASLSGAEKLNREQAARISAMEKQFKASSETISALQSQVSQLDNKLAAALKSQSSANAKIKKICSVKPKPKGC